MKIHPDGSNDLTMPKRMLTIAREMAMITCNLKLLNGWLVVYSIAPKVGAKRLPLDYYKRQLCQILPLNVRRVIKMVILNLLTQLRVRVG